MLSLDSDTYRADQADIENITTIESESDDDATLVAGLHPPFEKKMEHYESFTTKEAYIEQPVNVHNSYKNRIKSKNALFFSYFSPLS